MSLPALLGPYLLLHRQARGTIAELYLAQTIGDFPRACAVKCIRPEVAVAPGFAQRFRQEAALLVRLIHGNLVQVLEVGAVEEQLFVAMEQIDGVDLPDLVSKVPEQGPLPAELALFVGLELCEALAYVHQHRRAAGVMEAWPLQVMLSFDGVVKIIDIGSFGAFQLAQATAQGRLLRSPGYVVPEVILQRPLDQRSDLFAIGLMLWEILEGRPLLRTAPEVYLREIRSGSWRAPAVQRHDVAGDVLRLIAELLSLNPEERPASFEATRSRLVSSLRRVAPAYGSSNVAQLLRQRCRRLIQSTHHRNAELKQRSRTEPGGPVSLPTQSFGHADTVDRPLAPPVSLHPGDRIPGTRYRVVQQIGEGGSAQVFAAQHVDLDRQVAIKILSAKLASRSAAIAQFRMEARACSRIGHPNIVEVIDFAELDDGRFCFAMELLDGTTLAQALDEQQRLPPSRAIGICRQIAKALQAAHEQGIVHRDLKPENVMLVTRDGRADFVKLLDFGVMAFGADEPGHAIGTVGFMAPEQVRGERPTPAMDIYALGATLYEMLSGVSPYPDDSYEAFVRQQAAHAPRALRSLPGTAEVPESLERVVYRALERDPAARHPSMADLEIDLLRAQREAELVTAWDDLPLPTGMQERRLTEERPPARRTWRGWLATAAGISLVAGALLALQGRSATTTRTPSPSRSLPTSPRLIPTSPRLLPASPRLLPASPRPSLIAPRPRPPASPAAPHSAPVSLARREVQKRERRAPATSQPSRTLARKTSPRAAQVTFLVAQGQRHLEEGEFTQAQERFYTALRLNPSLPQALLGLATVAFEQAQYARAAELAQQLAASAPRTLQAHLLLGDAYFRLQRHRDALAAWKQALRLEPSHVQARRRIDQLEHREGADRERL